MKLVILILTILSCNISVQGQPQMDTTYLTNDSSLLLVKFGEFGEFYIIDSKKKISLFHFPYWAGSSEFHETRPGKYRISIFTNLPQLSYSTWRKYETNRYMLFIRKDSYSFFEIEFEKKYPKLSPKQCEEILTEAKNPETNTLSIAHYRNDPESRYDDSYTRNIGLLTLGILNNNSDCLKMFNNIADVCVGGEGCEAYTSLQKVLAYNGYDLFWRSKKHENYYLVKKDAL